MRPLCALAIFIAVVLLGGALIAPSPDANLWLWGRDRMIDGQPAFVVSSLTLAGFLRLRPAKKTIPTA